MNKLLVAITIALMLTGCNTLHPTETKIVYVDKPVPFIPTPPVVPKFDSQVDKLTLDDVADPGKVGQAYKYDMVGLRKLVDIYQLILQQYSNSSGNFDAINAEIDKLAKKSATPPSSN